MATATRTSRTRRKAAPGIPVVPILSLALLASALGIFLINLITFSQLENRLAADVTVAGIDVGGLTETEARVRWEQAYAQPIVLYYGDAPILLQPNDIDFRTNNETMLAEAISAGAQGVGNFWQRFIQYLTQQEIRQRVDVPLLATYQESLLVQRLQDIAARYDRDPGSPGFDVRTMTTYGGRNGATLDIAAAISLIDAALRDPENRTVDLPIGDSESSIPTIDTLRDLILTYLEAQNFDYDGADSVASVFVLDLQTGDEVNLLGDVAYSAASTTKVPIMVDFYRFKDFPPDQDESFIMANSLLCSRNSSSNLLLQLIAGGGSDLASTLTGAASVNETMQSVGAINTFLTAPYVEGVPNQEIGSIAPPPVQPNPNFNTEPDPYNQTTAEDMGTLFSMIYDCANYGSGLMTVYPGQFNERECQQMLNLTSANDLQRLLQAGLPPGTMISHKNGWIGASVGDAGIVYSPSGRDYVIAVFLWERAEFQDYTRLWPLLEGISRGTWNHFNPDNALLEARTDIPATAQECEGNYLPPQGQVNLDDINAWRE